jgi:S-adenosylmethionine uptake transporter
MAEGMRAPTEAAETSTTLRGMAFAVASYAGFASADAAIKMAGSETSVFQVAATLALFALLPVFALAWSQGGVRALWPAKPGLVALRAALTALCSVAVWHAFQSLPLAEVYALMFTAPLIATVMSAVLLGEEVGWRRWTATVVGFVAVLIMVRPGFQTLEPAHLLALIGAILGAASIVVLRRIGAGATSASILFALFTTIFLVSLPGAIAEFRTPTLADLALQATAGLLTGLSQAGLVLATRNAPAVVVAPVQYSQMLWGIVLGAVLFNNLPDLWQVLGFILLVASGLYTVHREWVRRRSVSFVPVRGEVPARAARG